MGFYLPDELLRLLPLAVGDTVIMTRTQGSARAGMTGTIRETNGDEHNIAVEFDNASAGFHDCDRSDIPAGHGYWIEPCNLRLHDPTQALVVGDRIIMLVDHDSAQEGDIGTIVNVEGETLGINFDTERSGFHSCRGITREGHGHWVALDSVERYMDEQSPIAPPTSTPPAIRRLSASEIEQGVLSI